MYILPLLHSCLTAYSSARASFFVTPTFTINRSSRTLPCRTFCRFTANNSDQVHCQNTNSLALTLSTNNSYEPSPSSSSSSSPSNSSVKFRPGQASDTIQIRYHMLRNLMNPLSLNYKQFIVATNSKNNNDIYGFVQIRPIGKISYDPNVYNSQPGSSSSSSSSTYNQMVEDLEEDIWNEFENDGIELPNGFGSLPWSKEYKTYVEKSKERREKYESKMKQIENNEKMKREEENDSDTIWELASVYVKPQWRGSGIGTELVRRIIENHVLLGRNIENLYLLTLDDDNGDNNNNSSTVEWYRGFGFDIVKNQNEIPKMMDIEMAVGSLIAQKIIGNKKLVCMRYYGADC